MSRLFHADLYRMYCNKRFWLCAASMIVVSLMFIIMQYTAMDYVVSLDRVLFLPMTFYGILTAGLISMFIGDDFSDGVIRNKLIAGRERSSVYISNLLTGYAACLCIYLLMLAITTGIGIFLFENNIEVETYFVFLILGMFICLAYVSIFCMLSMLIGNRSTSVLVCMGLAFFMLFLSLHTNQVLVQQEYKNGILNPRFVEGIRRVVYGILHDMNPTGQVAQLSAMEVYHPIRWIFSDLIWIFIAMGLGPPLFLKKDIK